MVADRSKSTQFVAPSGSFGTRGATVKLGIWCDFGATLEPTQGIGVFVTNLVDALARQPSIESMLLVAKAGEEEKLSPMIPPNAKIRVVGNPKPPFLIRKVWKSLRKVERKHLYELFDNKAPDQYERNKRWWVSPIVRYLDSWVLREKREWLDSVDLWLLPYVGLDHPFTKPTVVILHDLVTYHFPESVRPDKLAAFQRLVRQVTHQATRVTCMSQFILENDLWKTLTLPKDRTDMIRPAIPKDFSVPPNRQLSSEQTTSEQTTSVTKLELPEGLTTRRYLLYPAGFRSYKNHALLVEGLTKLSQEASEVLRNLHVVFTGISNCPTELSKKIASLGVSDRVHILGKVSRSELEALYRNAYATVVPSLYEQGSFPLMEALQFECPILASDIPSLREQLRSLGSSALYFDPRSDASLVQSLRELESDWEQRLRSQLEGFRVMQSRTWDDVASQWSDVFRRALGEH